MQRSSNIRVQVAADALLASVVIPPGVEAVYITAPLISALVRDAGIQIDARVESAVAKLVASYRPSLVDQVHEVARGTPASHGLDGSLTWHAGFDPNPPQTVSADRTDYHAGHQYVPVKVGDDVGLLKHPTQGTDGRDVRGGVLPARRGKAYPIAVDASLTHDNHGHLISNAQGTLILLDGRLRVSDALHVPGSVGLSTGNIDFRGSVTVDGGVQCDSKVRSDSDLTICGLIECSEIACGGNFTSKSGVVGHGRGTLHVQGNASLMYAEKLSGEIGGDLFVTRALVDCHLVVGGSMRCPAGTILGGQVSLEGSLEVRALGSDADTPTLLILGNVSALDTARRKALIFLEQATAAAQKIAEQERFIKLKPRPSAADRERLTEYAYELSQRQQEVATHQEALKEIDAAAMSRGTVDIHVSSIIHARVTLQVGRYTAQFMKPLRGPVWIGWDEARQLVYRIGHSAPKPISTLATVRTHAATPPAVKHAA